MDRKVKVPYLPDMTNAIANTTGRVGYFNLRPLYQRISKWENAEYNAEIAKFPAVFKATSKAAARIKAAVEAVVKGTRSTVLDAAQWARGGRGQFPFTGPTHTATFDGLSVQVRVRAVMLRLSAVTVVEVNLGGQWIDWQGIVSAEYIRDHVSRLPAGELNLSDALVWSSPAV